uniref:Uncharacterized protein n=1 Tax=Arundo donax TaxID=35708 RepID=A0A0A9FXQ4_ARUDO
MAKELAEAQEKISSLAEELAKAQEKMGADKMMGDSSRKVTEKMKKNM